MPCASSTTSNDGSARNRLAPFGFGAARPHLRRCRSSPILCIACVAAPCSWSRGAPNDWQAISDAGHWAAAAPGSKIGPVPMPARDQLIGLLILLLALFFLFLWRSWAG